ncbi:hypothetical protein NM208_g17186 [Fusarium decemcellulare]|uniref:Uncharacterized protein n=1 Tax=Fusarium decemcellulare TaxID=57161 RepID=A0ACC1R9A1_9HYPO|nr:hypothetical protein NM208_g17186 [Fusarium decemcellulare]
MLIQCRTEFIGLNAYLYKVNIATTAACPCGYRSQTVFHLFVYCPILNPARALLRAQLQQTDFTKLMTKDGAIAADWAISFFNIPPVPVGAPPFTLLARPTSAGLFLRPPGQPKHHQIFLSGNKIFS